MKEITSSQNEKIKKAAKLKEKNRDRKKSGLVAVEGLKEAATALTAGLKVREFFYCPEFDREKLLSSLKFPEDKTHSVTRAVFEKISSRENPDGFFLVAEAPEETKLAGLELGANPLLIIIEGAEKPGNLGAIVRTAEAAGADAVIAADGKTDFFNPNAIRSSRGAVFSVKTINASSDELIDWLNGKKIKTFAAAPEGKKDYWQSDFSGPSAIVLGEEHSGLSEKWLEKAKEKIRIPMTGKSDSLNLSVSAAVIIYEILRQRSGKLKVKRLPRITNQK